MPPTTVSRGRGVASATSLKGSPSPKTLPANSHASSDGPTVRRSPRPIRKQHSQLNGASHDVPSAGGGIKSVWAFLILALAFHCVYIVSIFDIYFRTPLVTGLLPVPPPSLAPPARRLVLFVGDGLRADKCFEDDPETGSARAPFLREVIAKERGVWGLSHTRVPTESRPGHVAMIAGFYEDVSAVTRGWKHNPVSYDHLLARARHAWSFGAPEIVQLFPGPNVTMSSYGEEMIDFSRDALELDRFSFQGLTQLFASADMAVHERLRGDQVFIFVHLLGLDTNGHAYRPHSREYHQNVAYVDEGVRQAVAMIDSYYGHDNRTAYLFTSDHGMSDAGTHGDGDPDNTRCPLLLWGAGVGKPEREDQSWADAEYMRSWNLSHIKRRDVNQADLTPLMATLLGTAIPINSEGVLPTHLLVDGHFAMEASLVNLRQLHTTLAAKEEGRRRTEPFFRAHQPSARTLADRLDDLAKRAHEGVQREQLLSGMEGVREDIFSGLAYYQKYDWLVLRIVISLGYVSWIGYALLYMYTCQMNRAPATIPPRGPASLARRWSWMVCVILGAAAAGLYLIAKRAPMQYFLYFGFPLFFVHRIGAMVEPLLHSPQGATEKGTSGISGTILRLLPGALLYGLGLELCVLCFFRRSVFALLMPAMGALSYWLFRGRFAGSNGPSPVVGLLVSLSGLFTLLDPIREPDHRWWLAGGLTLLLGTGYLCWLGEADSTDRSPSGSGAGRKRLSGRRLPAVSGILLRLLPTAMSLLVAGWADWRFMRKATTLFPLQLLAWIIVLGSFVAPFLGRGWGGREREGGSRTLRNRLVELLMLLAPAYIMLSVS